MTDSLKTTQGQRPSISALAEIFLSKTINDLDCSTRMRNALRALDVKTMLDLVEHKEVTLNYLRNAGKKTIQEIKDILRENDLSLGMNFSDEEKKYLRS